MNAKITKTPEAALRAARAHTSMNYLGGQYVVRTSSPDQDEWRESRAMSWHEAVRYRSEHHMVLAGESLGLDPEDAAILATEARSQDDWIARVHGLFKWSPEISDWVARKTPDYEDGLGGIDTRRLYLECARHFGYSSDDFGGSEAALIRAMETKAVACRMTPAGLQSLKRRRA